MQTTKHLIIAAIVLIVGCVAPKQAATTQPATQPTARPATQPSTQSYGINLTAALHPGYLREWTLIVLHHSATVGGSLCAFDAAHKKKGWGGIGYHFVIGNGIWKIQECQDGELQVTNRWWQQRDGIHVKGHNEGTIGIVLVGDFTKTEPTKKQMVTLRILIKELRRLCEPLEVVLHKDLAATLCPGSLEWIDG